MITLKEALKIANQEMEGLKLASIKEYPDRYTFEHVDENGKGFICSGPLYVMKDTGNIGIFFIPDYDENYLDSGVEIPLSKVEKL